MTMGKIKEKNQSKNDKKIEIKRIRMKLKKKSNDTFIVW
jgi:hypothetical protein